MSGAEAAGELDWLLRDLAASVRGIRHAIILSADGLALGRSPGMGERDADHLAAIAAGTGSLARGVGQRFGFGEVVQTVVEMASALLFITSAGRGTCLALLAGRDADAAQVAYEMAVLVKRVGRHMGANPRSPAHGPAPPGSGG